MASVRPNAQYNVAAPDSLPVRVAAHQRRKMFAHFLADTGVAAGETVLDVGTTSDRSYAASNYLEAWYPHKDKVTAVGLDDASFLCAQYPGLRFVVADALALPFRDRAFDVVHSSAVIEHVGSFARQCAFVRECGRVARRAVFITTPNRWFPVEFHTVLPLVHWLPKAQFRALMRRTGRGFFAEEANLNLMTAGELRRAAASAAGFACRVSSVMLAGWPSNLLLAMRRRDGAVSPLAR
jgi:ubiquinone/menaquinone biosynthesis C-methylase UbiE